MTRKCSGSHLVGDTANVSSPDPEVTFLSPVAPGVLHDEVLGCVSHISDSVSASPATPLVVNTSEGSNLVELLL